MNSKMHIKLPNICCCCGISDPNNTIQIKQEITHSSGSFESTHESFQIELPICVECKKKSSKYKFNWSMIAYIGVPLFTFEILYIMYMVIREYENLVIFGLIVAMLILYVCFLIISYFLGVKRHSCACESIGGSNLKIKNQSFVNAFIELNPIFTKEGDNIIILKH